MKKKILLLLLLFAVSAYAFTPSLVSFNTGQVSPKLEARSKFKQYKSSCRILENMFVLTQGPVTRRPGTKYIADANGVSRLIPFEYSTDDSYVLEIGDNYMRFCRNGGQILEP